LGVHRNLLNTSDRLGKTLQKLSTGMRINRAADDAAGLAISEKLRAQVRGLNQAARNAQDGISVVQTAESTLGEVESILQRLRELAVQGANDTLTSTDRGHIQTEVDQLLTEIDRISNTTEFNTRKLLDGTFSSTPLTLQVGANNGQVIGITISAANASGLGVSGISVGSHSLASAALASLDSAISTMSSWRTRLGATQNRLEYTISNLRTASENMTASESRIRDADMAEEMINMVRLQVLQQAGVAAQAQANMLPQAVLSLLG